MKHISGNDNIIFPHLNTLPGNRFFNVKNLVAEIRIMRPILFFRVHQKGFGNIGIAIFLNVFAVWAQFQE
ncbi:hypothetical protein D1872_212220 [compost metagenome]